VIFTHSELQTGVFDLDDALGSVVPDLNVVEIEVLLLVTTPLQERTNLLPPKTLALSELGDACRPKNLAIAPTSSEHFAIIVPVLGPFLTDVATSGAVEEGSFRVSMKIRPMDVDESFEETQDLLLRKRAISVQIHVKTDDF
jgi:hypothetical protein